MLEIQDFDQIRHIAVSLRSFPNGGFHAGLLYRNSHGELRHLHFAFHFDLMCEKPKAKYIAAVPKMAEVLQENLASFAESVGRRPSNQQIPYALRFQGTRFASDGQLVLGNRCIGLTCATFVLALFDSPGITFPLLDTSSWRPRAEDFAWHTQVVSLLRSQGAPQAHIDAVQAESDWVRFKPQEVFAGAQLVPPPPQLEACLPIAAAAAERASVL